MENDGIGPNTTAEEIANFEDHPHSLDEQWAFWNELVLRHPSVFFEAASYGPAAHKGAQDAIFTWVKFIGGVFILIIIVGAFFF